MKTKTKDEAEREFEGAALAWANSSAGEALEKREAMLQAARAFCSAELADAGAVICDGKTVAIFRGVHAACGKFVAELNEVEQRHGG